MPRKLFQIFAIFLSLHSAGAQATLRASSPNEYQVKAAFLNNFARFIEWPAQAFSNPAAPFVFGIVGDDPFEGLLDQSLNGKMVGSRRVEVRHLRLGPELRACHLLFISSSEKRRFSQVLRTVEGTSAITISETPGFITQGGMINFFVQDDRVQFEIAKAAIERIGAKISSRMLAVAKVV